MKRNVNGVLLNVEERGSSSAPAVVLLHYFGGSSQAWLPVIDLLSPRFRVIAPDLRGFGDSEAPAFGYAMSDGADDIAALLTTLNLEKYVLVGHSMGGKIALALAARRPAGLVSLVLLAPSPPTPEPMDDGERKRLLHGHSHRAEAEAIVRKITAQPLPEPFFTQAVEDSLRSSRSAWNAWLRQGSREDISALMSQVAAPALIVSGASDSVLPAHLLRREVFARLSTVRMTIIPESGHLSPLEAPEAVADIIDQALSNPKIIE